MNDYEWMLILVLEKKVEGRGGVTREESIEMGEKFLKGKNVLRKFHMSWNNALIS